MPALGMPVPFSHHQVLMRIACTMQQASVMKGGQIKRLLP
jgi:hypothetical protein